MTSTTKTLRCDTTSPVQEAGEAWEQAIDWSCSMSTTRSTARSAAPQARVGPGTSLLDVACGSGLVVGRSRMGRRRRYRRSRRAGGGGVRPYADRGPASRVHVRTSWTDGQFDAVLSVNGIWAAAVWHSMRPIGAAPRRLVAISFWGRGHPWISVRCSRYLRCTLRAAPDSMRRSTTSPFRVAEEMLERSGFSVLERGGRSRRWNGGRRHRLAGDIQRGQAVPALCSNDSTILRHAVLMALEPCRDRVGHTHPQRPPVRGGQAAAVAMFSR